MIPGISIRGLVRMLAVGAVAGSFFDGFHTHSGTTSYPHPVFWLMAWWTPLIFGGAYALLGVGYAFVQRGRRPPPDVQRRAWIGIVIFTGLYFASGYLPAANVVKLGVLLAGTLAIWAAIDRSPMTLALGIGNAIVGPVTEIVLVHIGAFSHLQPDVAGIPIWLPGLYLASAPSAGPFMAWVGGAFDGATGTPRHTSP